MGFRGDELGNQMLPNNKIIKAVLSEGQEEEEIGDIGKEGKKISYNEGKYCS